MVPRSAAVAAPPPLLLPALGPGKAAEGPGGGEAGTPTTTESECGEGEATGPAHGDEDEAGDGGSEPIGPRIAAEEAAAESSGELCDSAAALSPAAAARAAALRSLGAPGPSPWETLLVFDWDDTILPSTWLQRLGLISEESPLLDEAQQQVLTAVAASAEKMLLLAEEHGAVILLTNAEAGWIELSCQRFLPDLVPVVEGLRTVSARTSYESLHASPFDWKLCAFVAEIERTFGEAGAADPARPKNIVSLGDGAYEREALMRATATMPGCLSKSLKFVERPEASQLEYQHALVSSSLVRIVQHGDDLDLAITCS